MYPLRQNVALDVLFFAHDVNGDAVLGKINGDWTKNISKDGGAFGTMTVTITERAGGWYHLPISTAHSDTLGILTIYLVAGGVKQVNLQMRVHSRLTDESVDVSTWGGDAVNPLIGGRVDADAQVVSDKVGYELTGAEEDAIVDKVWNEAAAGHVTAGTFGKRLDVDSSTLATAAAVAALPTAAVNADAVWDEARAGHVAGGSFGEGVASVQGNVTGSAASVTGAVGSVTGSVGSVTGAVGSVTGGVGGSVTGSVGSIGAGGITAASFAAGAITAAVIASGAIDGDALAADAVDKIFDEVQDGSITARQALMIMLAGFDKVTGGGTTTIVHKNAAGTKDRITMTVDTDGNRSAVVFDLS